jgi:anti-anti-sigma regulatory factor
MRMSTQLELNVRRKGAMRGILTLGSLDPAFAAAQAVEGEMAVLDLRGVEFVEPSGLCALAALLEFLIPRSRLVGLRFSGHDVAAYLERMDFFKIFGHRVETNGDVAALEERRRGNPGTLQELISFHSEEEIPGIINRI